MPKGTRHEEARRNLAINLKYGRTLLGLTQEQLAEKANLDRTQIGAIERQASGASIDSPGALGMALGVPSHVLIMPPAEAHPVVLAATEAAASESRQSKRASTEGKSRRAP